MFSSALVAKNLIYQFPKQMERSYLAIWLTMWCLMLGWWSTIWRSWSSEICRALSSPRPPARLCSTAKNAGTHTPTGRTFTQYLVSEISQTWEQITYKQDHNKTVQMSKWYYIQDSKALKSLRGISVCNFTLCYSSRLSGKFPGSLFGIALSCK